MSNINKKARSKFFFETRSDLSMIWPSFMLWYPDCQTRSSTCHGWHNFVDLTLWILTMFPRSNFFLKPDLISALSGQAFMLLCPDCQTRSSICHGWLNFVDLTLWNLNMFPRLNNFSETISNLSMSWPSFCITEISLSVQSCKFLPLRTWFYYNLT